MAGNNKQTKSARASNCYYELLNNLFKPEFSRQMATSSMRNLRERNNLTKKIKVVSSSYMRIEGLQYGLDISGNDLKTFVRVAE